MFVVEVSRPVDKAFEYCPALDKAFCPVLALLFLLPLVQQFQLVCFLLDVLFGSFDLLREGVLAFWHGVFLLSDFGFLY